MIGACTRLGVEEERDWDTLLLRLQLVRLPIRARERNNRGGLANEVCGMSVGCVRAIREGVVSNTSLGQCRRPSRLKLGEVEAWGDCAGGSDRLL